MGLSAPHAKQQEHRKARIQRYSVLCTLFILYQLQPPHLLRSFTPHAAPLAPAAPVVVLPPAAASGEELPDIAEKLDPRGTLLAAK